MSIEINGDSDPSRPIVSIGVPTYDRPHTLRRVLIDLTSQTYKNLEIIVSDNCSSNPEVQRVCQAMAEMDSRIRVYRQESNFGAYHNFSFVLNKATGDLFMWAADDDRWHPKFIETLIPSLINKKKNYVAAMTEAHYFDEEGLFDFFPEGKALHGFYSDVQYDRVAHMLRYNYGNLFYSIFKLSVLREFNMSHYERVSQSDSNEIPLIIFIAYKGNWHVNPEPYFFKSTNKKIYSQAHWEYQSKGTPLPSRKLNVRGSLDIVRYHYVTWRGVCETISRLEIRPLDKVNLKLHSLVKLGQHAMSLLSGVKLTRSD